MMARLPVVYSERHRRHDTAGVLAEGWPLGSFEVPARAAIILDAVQAAGLGSVMEPQDHGLAPILALHDADYVQFLRSAYDEQTAYYNEAGPVVSWTFASRHAARRPRAFHGLKGYYAFGWGSPILEGTWEAAYWSAQCAPSAAGLVREGEALAPARAPTTTGPYPATPTTSTTWPRWTRRWWSCVIGSPATWYSRSGSAAWTAIPRAAFV